MSQAERSVSLTPGVPEGLSYIIGGSPGETIATCANICKFLGGAIVDVQRESDVQEWDADAIWRIMHTVTIALEWESSRVQFHRKPESEVANG